MSPTESTPILLARLETKLDNLDEKVDVISEKLYGNGKPGVIVDQMLQSKQITELLTYAKANSDEIKRLQNVTPPKWIATNWIKIIGTLIVFFLLIHSLVPADVSIWTIVLKFFGG